MLVVGRCLDLNSNHLLFAGVLIQSIDWFRGPVLEKCIALSSQDDEWCKQAILTGSLTDDEFLIQKETIIEEMICVHQNKSGNGYQCVTMCRFKRLVRLHVTKVRAT